MNEFNYIKYCMCLKIFLPSKIIYSGNEEYSIKQIDLSIDDSREMSGGNFEIILYLNTFSSTTAVFNNYKLVSIANRGRNPQTFFLTKNEAIEYMTSNKEKLEKKHNSLSSKLTKITDELKTYVTPRQQKLIRVRKLLLTKLDKITQTMKVYE